MRIKKRSLITFAILLLFSFYSYYHTKNSLPVTSSLTPSPAIKKSVQSAQDAQTFLVTKVVDGDTIKVSDGTKNETVRLIGIDTPETVDPRKTVQCFGKEASNRAKALLSGKQVTLVADPSQQDRDKYHRLLRYVYLLDGTLFNQQMIEDGYAYEYTYDVPYRYQKEFKAAEADARTAQRGLWNPATCNGKR